MAGQRKFQATAQSRAMYRGDHGTIEALELIENLMEAWRRQFRQRKFVDVSAGDEGPAGRMDNDGADGGVGLHLLNGGLETGAHWLGQGVDWRIVDPDDADVAVLVEGQDRKSTRLNSSHVKI